MARIQEQSGFFNYMTTPEGHKDRVYDATNFAEYFSTLIGNGVFINPTNQLKVIANTGLNVIIKKGRAFIDGYWFKLNEDITILMEANTTSVPTNNVVCCELNKQTREITIKKRQNVSSVQVKPINNGNIHELVLCNIKMPVGVSRITNDMIEDLRPNNIYCGFVETLVKQVDFQDLFIQFQDEFDMFMKNLKGKLSSDVAGSLQLQINELNNKINNMPVIRSGTGSVSNSVGKENDIYIQLVE